MNLRIKALFFLFACSVFVFSCKKDASKGTETKEVILKKTDATLKAELDVLRDSTDSKWNNMMASDDEKILDTKRLLDELGNSKSFDKDTQQKLLAANERLKNLRYERMTMADPQITAYDNATDSLLREVYKFTENVPGAAQNDLVKELVTEIQNADGQVGLYRSHYDIFAKQFNRYIRNYQEQLQKMGQPYSTYKQLPLFELQQQPQ